MDGGWSYIKSRTKSILRLSPRVGKLFKSLILVVIFVELVKLLPPVVFKVIIDRLVEFDPSVGITFELMVPLLVGYAGALFAMTLLEVAYARVGERMIRSAEEDITLTALKKLLALDVGYHEKHNTGTSINKVIKGGTRLIELFYYFMWSMFPVTIQMIVTLIVLFVIGWQIAVIFLIFVPLFLMILYRGAKLTQEAREEYHKHHDDFAGTITQSVSNIRTVKDFDKESFEIKKGRKSFSGYIDALLKRVRIGLKNRVFEDGIVSVGRVLTLVFAVSLMLRGEMTPGSLVLVVTLSEKAFINMGRLIRVYYQAQDIEPAIDRYNQIYDAPIAVKDNPEEKKRINKGKVEFDSVSFQYEKGDDHALKNVSFTIEPRTTAALVGRSGSGKSTAVKLLLRHFDPQSGCVMLDDLPADKYRLSNLRKGVAVVSQDVELFNDTILNNIRYANPRASRKAVEKAARMAHAHEFIVEFKKGYDSVIGERGVKLSGGQKQRVAIARALLKEPKILVFDEATSSLDAESEKYIHDAIFGLMGKLTLVIIAHRFSTIEHADKIILLEHGEVKEIGSHKELLGKKGIFYKLRKLQELGDVE